MTAAVEPAERHRVAEFLAANRGGGLFTETVNQRLGALLAAGAERLRLAPTVLTLANLVVGLAGSVGLIAQGHRLRGAHVVLGLAALLLWHLAYSLDCADGQLARVTGRSSPAGKRIDVLCDVAAQIALVSAIVSVTAAYTDRMPAWLPAAFAGTWMVNLVTSVLQQGSAAQSLVTSRSSLVRLVKLVRDFGAVITLVGLVLIVVPHWMLWVVVFFTAVNGIFLLASVAASARASMSRG